MVGNGSAPLESVVYLECGWQKIPEKGTYLGKGSNNQNGNLRWFLP